ncbi:MAG TPA: hypothetical protein VFY99_06665 [Solirubrobacterales bacterium]
MREIATGLGSRLTYANVIATIALFCALGGGTFAFAALKKNSVGTTQIAKNAVTSKKIAAGAVTDAKLGAITVGSDELDDGAVGTAELADNAVTGPKIADNAVTGQEVNESTLGEVPLAAAATRADNAFSAVVNLDGSLNTATQAGTTSVRNGAGTGNYSVSFGRDLAGCSAVATLGNAGSAIPNPGEIGTSLLNFGGPTSAVQVQTRNSAGAASDNGFHVLVLC